MGAVNIRQFQATFTAAQVDRTNRLIRGVSVMQVGEVRGHDCFSDAKTLMTVRDCAKAYKNGVKVRVDHGSGVLSIVGALRGFHIDEDGVLRGDLHLFEHAAEANRILELADEIPDTFGLSISFAGIDETIKKRKFARCEEIFAVDLVPEPAANATGLFSTKTKNLNMDNEDKKDKEEKDPIAELSQKFDKYASDMDERMKKLENPEKKEELSDDEEKKEVASEEEYKRLVKDHREMGIKLEAMGKLREFTKPATSIPATKGDKENEGENKKNFEALVKEKMEKDKVTKTEAITFCVKTYPNEHKEFVAQNKQRTL